MTVSGGVKDRLDRELVGNVELPHCAPIRGELPRLDVLRLPRGAASCLVWVAWGWISDTWAGNAGPTFYNNAPGSLSKQPQGSVSYLAPGDVVIINV